MAIYLCRWPNGDLSLACGKNRVEVEYVLDEVGDPDCAELTRIKHPVAVHWQLKEKVAPNETVLGALEFGSIDERSFSEVCGAYPILDDVLLRENALPEEIGAAVEREKNRVDKSIELSDHPDAAELQRMMGMSKGLAEYYVANTLIRRNGAPPATGVD